LVCEEATLAVLDHVYIKNVSLFQNVYSVGGSHGWTLAHMASFCGRLDCLQLLVKYHASVDCVDHDGNTPGAPIVTT